MFKDQIIFKKNEEMIKEWHIHNHIQQRNELEGSRGAAHRDHRMSKTI
jgi:hypothetical protein